MAPLREQVEQGLKQAQIFAGLSPAELQSLAARAVRKLFGPGEMLFSEGEPCSGFYVVTKGKIRIFKLSPAGREQVLAVEGPGSSVAELPVFDGGLIASHIDQAKAKEHSAIAQARQAEYLITRRIADASLRYDQAIRQLDILSRAQPTADDAFALVWTRFLGGGSATMLEVLDSYQQAELLRLQRPDQEFAAREAVAETNLLYGHIR